MAALQTFGPGALGGLDTFGPGTTSGGAPLPRWMVPGPCGCCTCTYFLDRFTRDDSSDLGDDWDEELGSWAIADYRLETTSSNARCICSAVDTPNNDPHVVSAALRGMGVGDQPRLISSKVTDADSYWFFEITYAATTVDLKLYQRTTGSNTQRGTTTTLYNMAPGIPLALRIAFDESEICAQYRRITDTIWTTATSYATTGLTDPICGVGTGTVNNEVRVDDFRLEKHGTLYLECPTCGTGACQHCEDPMPAEFLIVPTGPLLPPPLSRVGVYCSSLLPPAGYVVRRTVENHCIYKCEVDPPQILMGDWWQSDVMVERINSVWLTFRSWQARPHIELHGSGQNFSPYIWVKDVDAETPLCNDWIEEEGFWTRAGMAECDFWLRGWKVTAL